MKAVFWVLLSVSCQLRQSSTESISFVKYPNDTVATNLEEMDSVIHKILDKISDLKKKPKDCGEIWKNGVQLSGIYEIQPKINITSGVSFKVYCDMETDGGGWTVFQRRSDVKLPTGYFYRDWKSYAEGFGELDNDFWLGNDKLHYLTNQGKYSLRIDLKDKEDKRAYAHYREFRIGNGSSLYKLHVIGYSGDAGNSLSVIHHEMPFSTFDKDNDQSGKNCAEFYQGAWWYNNCYNSNLNGLYLNGESELRGRGIVWSSLKAISYSLPFAEMKVRHLQE